MVCLPIASALFGRVLPSDMHYFAAYLAPAAQRRKVSMQ
jgi:hypothetical protein